ncbi:MAG: hypothetical protein Q7S33_00070 [Nanoarchaeota archaeon]|nr:hypothetical protein [Nanoarchaeota archaeon]
MDKKEIKKEELKEKEFEKKVEKVEFNCCGEDKPCELNKPKEDKENKQIIWVIGISLLVILSFLGAYFYAQSLNKFEFAGIKWEKTKLGDLELYHGRFFVGEDQYYNFYLRNDPRQNEIPINATLNSLYTTTIVSADPAVISCYGASMGQIELSKFLNAVGVSNIQPAVTNLSAAKELNVSYADCSNAINKTVILIKKTETPSIGQDGKNCYVINVGNCENLKTIERFEVAIIAQGNGEKLK